MPVTLPWSDEECLHQLKNYLAEFPEHDQADIRVFCAMEALERQLWKSNPHKRSITDTLEGA